MSDNKDNKDWIEKSGEKVKAILAHLGLDLPVKKVEPVVKLEDVALKDGSMLNVDSLTVGAKATFTGMDGIPVPADGEYEAADGQIIVCVGGAITEIKPATADAQPEDMKAVLSALSDLTAKVSSFEGKFAKQEAEKKALELKLENQDKAFVDTLKLVDELSKTAAGLPLELQHQSNVTKSKFEKELSEEEYNKLSNKDKVAYKRIWA